MSTEALLCPILPSRASLFPPLALSHTPRGTYYCKNISYPLNPSLGHQPHSHKRGQDHEASAHGVYPRHKSAYRLLHGSESARMSRCTYPSTLDISDSIGTWGSATLNGYQEPGGGPARIYSYQFPKAYTPDSHWTPARAKRIAKRTGPSQATVLQNSFRR